MSTTDETPPDLDAAIRAAAEWAVNDGEVITSWLVVAGTREFDGGGVTITLTSDEGMPQWQARGLLATALRQVDRTEDADQGDA